MRKRIFFICGSMNQTTQMHQVSEHLREYEHSFSPYYCDGFDEILRRLGLMEFTIIGNKLAGRCRRYLQDHGLPIDYQGRNGPYDLVVTCSDVYLQKNIRDNRIVLVQEGITDPESIVFHLVKRFRFLPRWLAGTAATGLSDAYRAFCVASEGYRDFFIRKGARPEKIVVTGIPNFDDCRRYCSNDFPHRHYVLVCTSPLREMFRGEDREAFIRKAVEIAGGRQLIFKLHPNENVRARHPGNPPVCAGSHGVRDRQRGRDDRELRCPDHSIFVDGLRRPCARQGNPLGLRHGRIASADAGSERLGGPQHRECLPPVSRRDK